MLVKDCTPEQLQAAVNCTIGVLRAYALGQINDASIDWDDLDTAFNSGMQGFKSQYETIEAEELKMFMEAEGL